MLEYITDMSYVLLSIIGGLVAFLFVYVKRVKKKRVR